MHRSLGTAILAASFAFAIPALSTANTPEFLNRARSLLDRNEPKRAVEQLEDALPTTNPADRPALLDLLRRAYDAAARQADGAGRPDEAELYRENLAILEHTPRAARTPGAPPVTTLPKTAPPATAAPTNSLLRRASLNPEPATAASASAPAPEPKATPAESPAEPSSAAPSSAPTPQAAPNDPKTQLRRANASFIAQSYSEAGRIYGELANSNQLPKEYNNHLAYCRCVDVVKRINARPTRPEEWAKIDAEITKIQSLSPKLWYADYLRNKVAECAKGPNRSQSNKLVVRGASPDEPAGATLPANASAEAAGAPAPPRPVETGRWLVHETDNFRIFHADAALAERIAETAERARTEQMKRWAGTAPNDPWSPKCDIYLYPSAKIFSAMTGQPEDSPGFSTMGMDAGRINCRRVNLRADHPKIAVAILPHEVTHVVLADFFPRKQIPRWADEGIAVMAEPRTEQHLRAADLDEPLVSGRLFHVQDLMVMDYPNAEHWSLYYAQSVSLTRFLVEQGTPAQFIEFVQGCQQRSHEDELRRIYKINGFAELERRWLAFAKNKAATASATADNTKKDVDTASR